ncbi:MAG: cell division protein ZapE [Paracoccaceae bacterium]
MPQGPLHNFRALVAKGALFDDAAQRLAVEKLQLLHTRLKGYNPAHPKHVGLGLFGWGRDSITQAAIPGLYLYGGVGRGKSMLMDMFFDSAPIAKKRRVHFHAFMQEIHEGIRAARTKKQKDPIEPVAVAVANQATLLCFDEMQISDITDAMLVGRLFEKLFARGVVIVTTSNRHPDDLYENGLNRQLFLPFIEMMKDRLEVYHLESETDHRMGVQKAAKTYHVPLGPTATKAMDAAWNALTQGQARALVLRVKGREVILPQFANGVARASFGDLCEGPLGAADYLEIAQRVEVLLLDNIPKLSRASNNEAKRFVTLIDTLYEAKVRLICSAAATPEYLYKKGPGAFEFARTASRLEEMQGADWGA